MPELHKLEMILLKALKDGAKTFEELENATGLPEASIARAATWLYSKGYAKISEAHRCLLSLGPEGQRFLNEGFPERRLFEAVARSGCLPFDSARDEAGLSEEDMALAVGWAIKKGWLKVTQAGDKRILKVAQEASEGPDELLLKQLSLGSLALDDLPQEVAQALRLLKQRPNVLIVKDKVFRSVELTRNGQALAEESLHLKEEVSQVTPELLISGRWKDVEFRKYDIHVPVEPVWPGKKHPFRQFLDEVKLKLVALGFKEMVGPTVESMFFNCDALYMPQDHPAREIHDIYFVKHPSTGSLSKYSQYVSRVKATHEHGWETGSTGWLYRFSMVESSRLILRSQGTAVSTRKLIDADIEIPGKYFSITRVYRPDVVDRTHLTEFHHLEGIVLGEGLTFRSLLGVLETFAKEVAGADKVRFRPDYFPFTEPSVELAAYREGAGWIELGGAGIFRPEVTGPLGINVPVIAWGLGINRMFMMRRGIRDIRYIFSQDLTWLRNQRVE